MSKEIMNGLSDFNKVGKERIAYIDSLHLDPVERAEKVQEFLFTALRIDSEKGSITNPLFWDLLCYCSQLFAVYAIQIQDGSVDFAKSMNSYLMSRHYSLPEDHPSLGPSRAEHTQIWLDRIELITEIEDGV